MLLQEAIKNLESGKPMHREHWKYEEGYLLLLPGMENIWKILITPNPNAGNFIFSLEDLIADDWKEFVVCEEPEAEVCSESTAP